MTGDLGACAICVLLEVSQREASPASISWVRGSYGTLPREFGAAVGSLGYLWAWPESLMDSENSAHHADMLSAWLLTLFCAGPGLVAQRGPARATRARIRMQRGHGCKAGSLSHPCIICYLLRMHVKGLARVGGSCADGSETLAAGLDGGSACQIQPRFQVR